MDYRVVMSWFMASLYDRVMRETEAAGLGEWRAELLGQTEGRVLELGAGTGANLALYPNAVRELLLQEPDRHMRRQLQSRLRATPDQRVKVLESVAERLPFADGALDWVVSTLVLCSVSEPARCLHEVARVLRPGGALVFIEHVCAHDNPSRLSWQRRMEPLWKRVAGGCHLTRDTAALIEAAGLTFESLERASLRKAPPIVRPCVRGVARKPEAGRAL